MRSTIQQSFRRALQSSSVLLDCRPVQRQATKNLWTCAECRGKSRNAPLFYRPNRPIERQFTFSAHLRASASDKDGSTPSSTILDHVQGRVQTTNLPSQKARDRWEISEQMTRIVDRVLSRASIAGQHINAYTGTDYSGIDALRKEILQQEQRVKECHSAVTEAKRRYNDDFVAQSSEQKEIVSLLERKSSWLPADLERYMALVRSEHVNDQSVQGARAQLESSERELEGARGLLEKLERQQYHEEQIWSDTIRRNSTWVTFGLMGVNIILLLAQILVFEPYRRKKIVRDMKEALDSRTLPVLSNATGTSTEQTVTGIETIPLPMPTADVQAAEETHAQVPNTDILMHDDKSFAPSDPLPEEAVYLAESVEQQPSHRFTFIPFRTREDQTIRQAFVELFSDRRIEMRQIDLTALVARSVVAGAATIGLVMALWRAA